MKTRNFIAPNGTLLLLSTLLFQLSTCPARAQGTAFVFQGREVNLAGKPFTGTAHLTFTLYSAPLGGSLLPAISPLDMPTVPVVNGLFSVELDFGAGAFDGSDRWLEVQDVGLNITFPRQHIVAVPYAVMAGTLGGVSANNFWQLGGNHAGTGTSVVLGNLDSAPLELWVNNSRALRLEPDSTGAGAPNFVAGSSANTVSSPIAGVSVVGATIGGGGAVNYQSGGLLPNSVFGDFGTISGGGGNQTYSFGTVGGGRYNDALNLNTTVSGGYGNTASGYISVIAGGENNQANGDFSVIGGGQQNTSSGQSSLVAGGSKNSATADYSTVSGGNNN